MMATLAFNELIIYPLITHVYQKFQAVIFNTRKKLFALVLDKIKQKTTATVSNILVPKSKVI